MNSWCGGDSAARQGIRSVPPRVRAPGMERVVKLHHVRSPTTLESECLGSNPSSILSSVRQACRPLDCQEMRAEVRA